MYKGVQQITCTCNCYNCYRWCSFNVCCVDSGSSDHDSNTVMPRKLGEAIGSTVGAVASVVNYPLGQYTLFSKP